MDALSSSVEVGSEEDQNSNILGIIADVLNDVTILIEDGGYSANPEACILCCFLKINGH